VVTFLTNFSETLRLIQYNLPALLFCVAEYLNFAEISLIVLSAIVLFLLILLLIWSIIRCQRRKRSRDFLSR